MKLQSVAQSSNTSFKSTAASVAPQNKKTIELSKDDKKKILAGLTALAALGAATICIVRGKKTGSTKLPEIKQNLPETKQLEQKGIEILKPDKVNEAEKIELSNAQKALEAAVGLRANKSAQESAETMIELLEKQSADKALEMATGLKANKSAMLSAESFKEMFKKQDEIELSNADKALEAAVGIRANKSAQESAMIFEQNRPSVLNRRIGDIIAYNENKLYVNPKIEAQYKKMKPETISALPDSIISSTLSHKGKPKKLLKNLSKLEREFSVENLQKISENQEGTDKLLKWLVGDYSSPKQYQELAQTLHAFI